MIRLFDSHTHINDPAFRGEEEAVLARAREAGVVRMMVVGYSPSTIRRARELAETHPDHVVFSVATHPHEARTFSDEHRQIIEAHLPHPLCRAIGETGLDYFKRHSEKDVQREVLEWHLDLAVKHQKPVIFHVRDAFDDVLEILAAYASDLPGGIFHCYTGDPERTERILQDFPGFYLSFSGILTFRPGSPLEASARMVPLDRLLIETDAPYLAPVPYRGKRNEPAYLTATFQHLARLRDEPPEVLARALYRNACTIYGLDPEAS